jgi:hypothetical protein
MFPTALDVSNVMLVSLSWRRESSPSKDSYVTSLTNANRRLRHGLLRRNHLRLPRRRPVGRPVAKWAIRHN